jgi:hypothetical protein
MKLGGKKVEGSNYKTIVIPRGDGDPVVMKACAVLDYSTFDKICPRPTPPTVMKRGGVKTLNFADPRYTAQIENYGHKRISWIVLESLRLGTPDLEWEQVDLGDPDTWTKYDDELTESGFSFVEIQYIISSCMEANALDEEKLDEARKSFLLSMEVPPGLSSSLRDEQENTESGEPASE